MKKSNFWIWIVGWGMFFVGLAYSTSFCPTKNYCMESQAIGIPLMVVGLIVFFGGLYLINKWSGGK